MSFDRQSGHLFGGDERFDWPGKPVIDVEHWESQPPKEATPPRPRVLLPLILFLATCASTFLAGLQFSGLSIAHALQYSGALMTILVCHEMGHFFQARRHGVPASLPYFIPMPLSIFGTFGAVIVMSPRIQDRRALFDIGVTGPLAGLVPVVVFLIWGLRYSSLHPILPGMQRFGDPLLFKLLYRWYFGPIPPGWDVVLHPLAWAAWVGLLLTALNLIPIGQLDGGHVLYALLGRRAHAVAQFLLVFALVMAVLHYWWWLPMVVLLLLMGPRHPPTGNDHVPLGVGRTVLGWLAMCVIVVGFTPEPIIFESVVPHHHRRPAPRRYVPEKSDRPIMVHRGESCSPSVPAVTGLGIGLSESTVSAKLRTTATMLLRSRTQNVWGRGQVDRTDTTVPRPSENLTDTC